GDEDEWEESSNASLITPRIPPGQLAAELAFADTAQAEPLAARATLPADDEPDTTVLGPGDDADRTLPKGSATGASDAADSRADAESELTEPRAVPEELLAAAANAAAPPAAVALPPMRPRLDSEAAGHWPTWQAETEGARAAMAAVPSP